MSVKTALRDAKRMSAMRAGGGAVVLLIEGCPEPNRVLGLHLTERQAMIGTDLIEAEATESVKAFHRRLVEIARAKGRSIVSLGSGEPVKASRYDQSGSLIEPEPPVLH